MFALQEVERKGIMSRLREMTRGRQSSVDYKRDSVSMWRAWDNAFDSGDSCRFAPFASVHDVWDM